MFFFEEDLLEKRKFLEKQLIDLEIEYSQIIDKRSPLLQAIGKDILSLRSKIQEIDNYLVFTTPVKKATIPRRESFPTNPTRVVSGNPIRRGILFDAEIVQRSDGTTYFVDKKGRLFLSETEN